MSYDSVELSEQSALSVMLFQFVQGSTTYYYTNAAQAISRNGSSWIPVAVKCGRIKYVGEVPKDALGVELPYDNPLAATFLGAPDFVTWLTVFRAHHVDTATRAVWMGRVVSSVFNDKIAQLSCESLFTSLQRRVAHRVYQRTCPHVFGEVGTCNFPIASVTSSLTATAIAGVLVTVPDAAALTKIEGGTLTYGGVRRMILKHEGTTLTLMRAMPNLALALSGHPEGVSVDVAESCSQEPDDPDRGCRARGNMGNYGGWLGIPLHNPFGANIMVMDT